MTLKKVVGAIKRWNHRGKWWRLGARGL